MANEKQPRYFFNKNVSIGKVTKDGIERFSFNRGELCPAEFEKEMIEAKHLSKNEPEAIDKDAKINLVKKSKLPEMASRG